jgi:hypothetical protein
MVIAGTGQAGATVPAGIGSRRAIPADPTPRPVLVLGRTSTSQEDRNANRHR